MISANGEREIGELIAKAMEKVGKEGVITISVSFYLIILLISVVCLFYLWKVFCFYVAHSKTVAHNRLRIVVHGIFVIKGNLNEDVFC